MNRQGVHADSGSPLGAANPHQEGPPDLRLVPPAVGAWAAAAIALNVPGRWAAWGVVTLLLVVAVMLLAPIRGRRGRGAEADHAESDEARRAGAG
ncbi:MBL fold metallo-hydrolase, partial [Streptomyces sp. YS-3]